MRDIFKRVANFCKRNPYFNNKKMSKKRNWEIYLNTEVKKFIIKGCQILKKSN